MKRTINCQDEDSEDEIWNYKSNRQGSKKTKHLKNVSRAHKLADCYVALPSIEDHPGSSYVGKPDVSCPGLDRNDERKRSDPKRKGDRPKEGKKPFKQTKRDLPNVVTTSELSELTLKSPCSQNTDPLNLVSTPSRQSMGYCPSCQAPFSALITDSPGWHAMQCLEVPFNSPRPECSLGANCTNAIMSHYQKYSHSLLALLRAGLDPGDNFAEPYMKPQAGMTSSEICSNSSVTCSKQLIFEKNTYDRTYYTQNKQIAQSRGQSGNFCFGESDDFQNLLSIQCSTPDIIDPIAENYRYIDDRKDARKSYQLAHSAPSEHFAVREFETPDLCLTSHSSAQENFGAEENDVVIPSENQLCSGSTQSNDSELDMFHDLSDMLSDVFGEDTLVPTPQPTYSKFSGSGISSSVGQSVLANIAKDETVPKNDAERGVQMSTSRSSRFVDKNIGKSRPVCSPMKQTASLKHMKTGQNNSMQQLSMNMFFKRVNGLSDSSLNPKDALTKRKEQHVVQSIMEPSKVLSEKQSNDLLKKPITSIRNILEGELGQSKGQVECKATLIMKSEKVVSNFNRNSVVSDTASSGYPNYSVRKCPFYKRIPNTSICVDAFNYGTIPGCSAYFLSHFHYDHYGGLTKNFPHHLYCSKVTANLVLLKIRVKPQLVHTLPLNEPHIVEGVEVTLLDANHCPGSVMLLFKVRNGQVILHTGDFRADPSMEQFPQLQSVHISRLFLDTTYCDPSHDFPSQRDVVHFAVGKALDFMGRNPKTLVAVGTYTIGKERIFLALAEALDCEIYATRDKKNILNCLEDKSLNKRLTLKAANAGLHVLKMNQINLTGLSIYLESLKPGFDHLLAFEPTGWTHSKKTLSLDNLRPKASSGNVTIYAVPYSEHSSYSEMKRFVQFLQPEKIIPTVNNGNPASRKKMEELFNAWHLSHHTKRTEAKSQQVQLNQWLENV